MAANSVERKDRVWLSQLLLKFALSSSVNGQVPQTPSVCLGGSPSSQSGEKQHAPTPSFNLITGSDFYEQALGTLPPVLEQTKDGIHTGWPASPQMGLLPSLQSDQVDLGYPTEEGLNGDNRTEFLDPDFLTARIQLTISQADAANSACHFGGDDAKSIDSTLRPILRRLDEWKTGQKPHMVLDVHDSMFSSAPDMPRLRSLANLKLRYNQINCIFANEKSNAELHEVQDLNNICLNAARSSLGNLIELRRYGLLAFAPIADATGGQCMHAARFGFMENMHDISSLIILCLAMAINARVPDSFFELPDDGVMYDAGKDVLHVMAQAGGLAAKGHEHMLHDVEALRQNIIEGNSKGTDVGADHWDIDELMTHIFESENLSDMF
ncbi:hypothetical protein SPI_07013 [Niveomyces insectorum RCEF 264]|uniref:C6 zinc finger domain containing protein n=1 Tax=Niveomyces insectorum RCEF 264 TaxID=1081102 RepID=A0A167QZH6_9HYPO|nr:hypothetical protein SPI_07013 [Niveomyces insectorum RCEF 264]